MISVDIVKSEIDERKIVVDRTMSNQPIEIFMRKSSLNVIDFYTMNLVQV